MPSRATVRLAAALPDHLVLTSAGAAADAQSWWGEILGSGKPFDVEKYLIVCANVLGSCYGTCGPTTNNPMTGQPYGGDFPLVTVRDSVRLHSRLLIECIGALEVRAVVGGSMGGMQALEWAFPDLVEIPVRSIVAIACNGCHQPWQIGFSGELTTSPCHVAACAKLSRSRVAFRRMSTPGNNR